MVISGTGGGENKIVTLFSMRKIPCSPLKHEKVKLKWS